MKKFLVLFFSIFICSIAHAATEIVHYYVDNDQYSTTCESGGNLILPTPAPRKGYTFVGYQSLITPVEYLANNNYDPNLNTGIQGSNNIKIRLKFNTLNLGGAGYPVFGGGSYLVRLWGTKIRFDYNNTSILCEVSSENTYDFLIGPTYIKNYETGILCGGSQTTTEVTNSSNLLLNTGYGLIQPILLQIWDGEIMVRDFVPVHDQNGTAAMYDKIHGEFYYGTGWTAGPEINE